MKFILEIDLGQEMTYAQIADALGNTASSLRSLRANRSIHNESHGVYLHREDAHDALVDVVSGSHSRVGTWAITDERDVSERAACELSKVSARSGKSIFQVAKANGVTDQRIIDRACAIANGAGPLDGSPA